MAKKTDSIDSIARWVNTISFDENINCWKATMFGGKIVISQTFPHLVDRMYEIIGRDLLALVCLALNVEFDKALSKNRDRELVEARNITCYIAATHFRITYSTLARAINYVSHASINTGVKNVEQIAEVRAKCDLVYRAYPWIKDIKQSFK